MRNSSCMDRKELEFSDLPVRVCKPLHYIDESTDLTGDSDSNPGSRHFVCLKHISFN